MLTTAEQKAILAQVPYGLKDIAWKANRRFYLEFDLQKYVNNTQSSVTEKL